MQKKIVGGILVGVIILVAGIPFLNADANKVIPGLSVDGKDIGGYTKAQVSELLHAKEEKLADGVIYLTHENYKYPIALKDLNIQVNIADTEKKIFAYGRSGNIMQQWWERVKGWFGSEPIHYEVTLADAKLHKNIAQIAQILSGGMKNAAIVKGDDGAYHVQPELPHMVFDAKRVEDKVRENIRLQKTDPVPLAPTQIEKPSITKEMLAGIDSVLGECTTYFGGDYNRGSNIILAAHTINGTFLNPGEVFSYNNRTGARTAAAGYLAAPVFIDGKLEPGTGGGVCQVSTTLFNAVLVAGMEVVTRTPHFAPVGYIEIGRDATVSYGSIDFAFRNSMPNATYIMTDAAEGYVTIKILGKKADMPVQSEVTVGDVSSIPYKTKEKVDAAQKEAKVVDEGHEGYEATVYRHVAWADGREVNDSFYSYYEPVDTVITLSPAAKKAMDEKAKKEQEAKDAKKGNKANKGKKSEVSSLANPVNGVMEPLKENTNQDKETAQTEKQE